MKFTKNTPGVGKYMKKISEIKNLERMFEEYASAPKEEMGKRTPGERCMYEMQPSTANRMPLQAH